jgi:phage head maturation protease
MTDDIDIIDEPVPRDYAVRATMPGPELVQRSEERPGLTGDVMRGSLAVFDEWARIDSRVEGQFMERLAPGSFRKTIAENRSRIRSIYDHGQDQQFGRHPLGPIDILEERDRSVDYEVPLLDTPLIRNQLVPGLRAGLYGSSFRFRPTKVERVRPKAETDYNPDRWEERTVRELEMVEFGPTPFPTYFGATAGLRSMTDEYRIGQLGIDPEELRELLEKHSRPEPVSTRATEAAPSPPRFRTRQEYLEWLTKT